MIFREKMPLNCFNFNKDEANNTPIAGSYATYKRKAHEGFL